MGKSTSSAEEQAQKDSGERHSANRAIQTTELEADRPSLPNISGGKLISNVVIVLYMHYKQAASSFGLHYKFYNTSKFKGLPCKPDN